MNTSKEIRKLFLNYFKNNDHKVLTSSSLIPHNDPSLLFTSAGMVQFKDIFIGNEKPSYSKATTIQKCLRATDLNNVGKTARHHTFFEMLGNFSFGDYFKEDAIKLAWNFLVHELGIPEEKLSITVYTDDDEAISLWKKISGFSDHKITRNSDNFWKMGETGPCGPCSEIFYDHGSSKKGEDRFVEIWNLVFMQYNQISPTNRVKLTKPSIDTGMGLERIATVLQGVHDNFDIDLFQKLINESINISGSELSSKTKISHRIIADHIRASSFLIADGITPSNEGRGYVLRRIMRRAMRHSYLLGHRKPFMWKLADTLIDEMGEYYHELLRAQEFIKETLLLEEEKFRKTLEHGLKLLHQEIDQLKPYQPLSGEIAFKLYDTYGFPIDLTQDILKEEKKTVKLNDFNKAMENQRKKAKKSWTGSGEGQIEKIWFDIQKKHEITKFIGYQQETCDCTILSIIINNQEVNKATTGQNVLIITDQTTFYPTSGGQECDKGLFTTSNAEVEITKTYKKLNKIYVHEGTIKKSEISILQKVHMQVDIQRRSYLKANHTATHLLHAVLRNFLGTHVVQKGSLVSTEKLRFDFNFSKKITKEMITTIQKDINTIIRQNIKVKTSISETEKALNEGAVALFGEKYEKKVRVVSIEKNNEVLSKELCGGLHVQHTGNIGYLKIISESSISSGVRRIEALTGLSAENYINSQEEIINKLSSLLKVGNLEIINKVSNLIDEQKTLKHKLKKIQKQPKDTSKAKIFNINNIKIAYKCLEEVHPKTLRPLVDQYKKEIKKGIIIITTIINKKPSIVIGVTNKLTNTINAVDLAKLASKALEGKGGGGRPDFAQAGGTNTKKINDSIKIVLQKIAKKLDISNSEFQKFISNIA